MLLAIVVFDIDGVVRDVSCSYRRAIADTVEKFTAGAYRPAMAAIDQLKSEGVWNNDWEASRELTYRYFESQGRPRSQIEMDYDVLIDFFQSRYRGTDPHHWNGYITAEPLLLQPSYLETLSTHNIAWGFFSGATRGSAEYVLKKRLGLGDSVLVAMEDAPGKPDPTGLLAAVSQLEAEVSSPIPVLYVGDTVADMHTVGRAKTLQPERTWLGVGILPPHLQSDRDRIAPYTTQLETAGAAIVLENVQDLTPDCVLQLI